MEEWVSEYGEVNGVVGELVEGILGVLGEKVVGVYLYGSLVMGDFDLDVGDLDLMAALKVGVDEEELERLRVMHEGLVEKWPAWYNRIEVQYATLDGLRTMREKATVMANISPGEALHFLEAGIDWLMNWYTIRERGVVLYGVEAKEIIPPISLGEYMEAGARHIREGQEWVAGTRGSRPYQGYAILTACRALYLWRKGEQASKKVAMEWAVGELPEWEGLIRDAWSWRMGAREEKGVDPEATFPRTVEFMGYVGELLGKE